MGHFLVLAQSWPENSKAHTSHLLQKWFLATRLRRGWRWGGKPGCRRRKNDCTTEAVTQRKVRLTWPRREHRRDPHSQLSLGCVRASRSRRICASHSVTVPYGMCKCSDAPVHFLAMYSHLQAFKEVGGAESESDWWQTKPTCTWGFPRGHSQAWACLLQPLQRPCSSALRAASVSTGWAGWHREPQKLQG